jgi:hypothetical protein
MEHTLISVFYLNITNFFYKTFAKMGFPSFFPFVYISFLSFPVFRIILSLIFILFAKCNENVSDLARLLLIRLNFSPYLSISKNKFFYVSHESICGSGGLYVVVEGNMW